MTDAQTSRADFVEGMSRAAFTVSVVTTDGTAGRAGITVSAMTSVSADPASILVCVNRQSRFASKVQGNGCFAVSILAETQSQIADIFAGRDERTDRFSTGRWQVLGTTAPALNDAIVAFDCRLIDVKPIGTHDIAIGLVERVVLGDPKATPLIHHRRRYGRPELVASAVHLS